MPTNISDKIVRAQRVSNSNGNGNDPRNASASTSTYEEFHFGHDKTKNEKGSRSRPTSATSATSAPELATLAACQNLNPGDAAIPPSHILHQSNGPRAP